MSRFAVMPLVMLCSCAVAQPRAAEKPSLASASAADIEAFIEKTLASSPHVAVSIAVTKAGQPLVVKAYGARALGSAEKVTVLTPFAIGSVSKQFAAACIFLLAQQGTLTVTEPISRWFPKSTGASDITLLDLMHHTSGYRDYYPLDFIDARLRKETSADDIIARYTEGPLDFEPRTRSSYSNTGYLMLARVVEKVTGESYGAFATRSLLEPLGLKHTSFAQPDDTVRAMGAGRFALGPLESAVTEARDWLKGAADVWSTSADLTRWNEALTNGKVLELGSWWQMTAPHRLKNGAVQLYGGGLYFDARDDEPLYAHTGAISGFRAASQFNALGDSVVVLSSFDDFNPGPMGSRIFKKIASTKPVPVVAGAPIVEVA